MSLARRYGGGASSGGQPTLASALSSYGIPQTAFAQPEPEPDQGFGFLGWNVIKNVPKDIGTIVHGLGDIVAGVATDAVNLGIDAVELTGLKDNEDRSYTSDDLLKGFVFDPEEAGRKGLFSGISPLLQSYAEEAYGLAPLEGKFGELEKVKQTFIKSPVSTLLDLYGGAAVGGEIAGRAALSRAGRAGALDPSTAAASTYRSRILPGAGQVVNVPDGVGGIVPRVLPGGHVNRVQGVGGQLRVEPHALSYNPVRRQTQKLYHRATTTPLSKYRAAAEDASRRFDVEDPLALDISERQTLRALEPEQRDAIAAIQLGESAGLTRIEHARIREFRTRKAARQLIGAGRSLGYNRRTEAMEKRVKRHFDEVVRSGRITVEKLEKFFGYAQGIRRAPSTLRHPHRAKGLDDIADEVAQGTWGGQRLPDEVIEQASGRFRRLRQYRDAARIRMQATQQQVTALDAQLADPALADDARARLEAERNARAEELVEDYWNIEGVEEYASQQAEYLGLFESGVQATGEAELIARLNWDRHDLVMEYIDRGSFRGFNQVMEVQYGPLHLESNASRLGMRTSQQRSQTDFTGPDVNPNIPDVNQRFRAYESIGASVEGLMNSPGFWKQYADDFRHQGWQRPMYFPHMDMRRVKLTDLLMGGKGAVEKFLGTGMFEKRTYQNYIDDIYLADDPLEVLARRMGNMQTNLETLRLVENVIHTFGRKVRGPDDYNPAAESLYNPKGTRPMWDYKNATDEKIGRARQVGQDFDWGVQQAWDDIKVDVDAVKREVLDPPGELWAVPKPVADVLNQVGRYQFGPYTRLLWDGYTNAWRTSVLGLSPRWTINNLLGDVVFAKMQGVPLRSVLSTLAHNINKEGQLSASTRVQWMTQWFGSEAGAEIAHFIESLPDLQRAEIDNGLFASVTQQTNLGAAAKTLGGALADKVRPVGRKISRAAELNTRLNHLIEQSFREASFAHALNKQLITQTGKSFIKSFDRMERIAATNWTHRDIQAGIGEVNKFFGNYRTMSPLERGFIRRFIAPFYGFYRHVAMLTLRFPIEDASRAFAMRMLAEVAKEVENESWAETIGLLPDYLRSSVPFGEGEEEGKTRFLNWGAANPLGGFGDVLEDPARVAGMMHPNITMLAEMVTGRDMMTGREFSQPGVGRAYGGGQFAGIYDDAGNLVGVSDEPTKVRPNLFESFLGQQPWFAAGRSAVDALKGQGTIRLDAGGRPIIDRETGQPQTVDPMQSIGRWAGVSTSDVDVAGYQEYISQQRMLAAIDLLRQQGVLPPSEE